MNNEAILFDFMERVWNGKEAGIVEKYVDSIYTIHIDTGDPWEGKTLDIDEFKVRLNYSFDSFPDMHFNILTSVADGNFVAINWIMTGTNLGPIGGFPPTGKSIKTNGFTIYHFNNGKICGHSQVFDRTTVMKQLGFIS
ncbi:MAG: ester cyclase [Chitinophagaceae bacterium]